VEGELAGADRLPVQLLLVGLMFCQSSYVCCDC
jgi:hypothetical protein